MVRNILGQSLYQIALIFFLLFEGPQLWGLESGNYCRSWTVGNRRTTPTWRWNGADYSCNDFQTLCAANFGPGNTGRCVCVRVCGQAEPCAELLRVLAFPTPTDKSHWLTHASINARTQ